MGGGLMQLVAYGAQDIYLTGNPQITFFKVVYRRHTNFSMETIQQSFSGDAIVGVDENESSCTISRNGDLIHKIYLTADGSRHNIKEGSKIIKEVELSIGGQKIDMYTQEWQDIWNELTTTSSKSMGLKSMTSDIGEGGLTTYVGNSSVRNIQIPLLFWFCRNPGLSLPLIALQYHDVKLNFIFNKITKLGKSNETTPLNLVLYVDYIYLDTDERKRFAQVSHEYLIEQLQIIETNNDTRINLNFNHPVKELIWTSQSYTTSNSYHNAKLVLNGQDRFSKQPEEYFQLRQPFDYHTSIPHQNLPTAATYSEIHSKFMPTIIDSEIQGIDHSPSAGIQSLNESQFAYGALVTLTDYGKFNLPFANNFAEMSTADAASITKVNGVTDLTATNLVSGNNFTHHLVYPKNLKTGSGDLLEPTQFALVINETSEWAVNFVQGRVFEIMGSGKYWGSDEGYENETIQTPLLIEVLKTITVAATQPSSASQTSGGFVPDATGDTYKYVIFSGFLSDLNNLTGITLTNHTEQVKSITPKLHSLAFEAIEKDTHRQASTSHMTKKINVYSFALKPEEHQPSGSCNFSRIDTAHLITDMSLGFNYHIYAVNYNVLRIMSGMGGLAYSN